MVLASLECLNVGNILAPILAAQLSASFKCDYNAYPVLDDVLTYSIYNIYSLTL